MIFHDILGHLNTFLNVHTIYTNVGTKMQQRFSDLVITIFAIFIEIN